MAGLNLIIIGTCSSGLLKQYWSWRSIHKAKISFVGWSTPRFLKKKKTKYFPIGCFFRSSVAPAVSSSVRYFTVYRMKRFFDCVKTKTVYSDIRVRSHARPRESSAELRSNKQSFFFRLFRFSPCNYYSTKFHSHPIFIVAPCIL